MSKITSILEKYNLIENVDKKNSNDMTPENENAEDIVEVFKNVNKEEIKVSEPFIKEDHTSEQIKIEYDRKMMADEIYSYYGLESNSTSTVFMLESLINALPQNLPQDVIKQTITNIINASDINLGKLLSDGEKRLKILVKLMDDYYNKTNNAVAEYKAEIAKLSGLINYYQEQIKVKETMLEEQSYIVKYETQKIDNIIDFFRK